MGNSSRRETNVVRYRVDVKGINIPNTFIVLSSIRRSNREILDSNVAFFIQLALIEGIYNVYFVTVISITIEFLDIEYHGCNAYVAYRIYLQRECQHLRHIPSVTHNII